MTGPEGDVHLRLLGLDVRRCPALVRGARQVRGCHGRAEPRPAAHAGTFAFEETAGGSRLTTISRFDSLEQMQQLLDDGSARRHREAMSQIDTVLADLASFASNGAGSADPQRYPGAGGPGHPRHSVSRCGVRTPTPSL